jgi:NAD+--asparagine ADP-ribosyltransferase
MIIIKLQSKKEEGTAGKHLFVSLVELAKTIATSTHDLRQVFSCCICPQGHP